MILMEVHEGVDGHTYRFVRLRSDRVELDNLWIYTDLAGVIQSVEIANNELGDCAFDREGKLLGCSVWESENAAQEVSSWSRHYPLRSGGWQGTIDDALNIYANLRQNITDTYLRYILGAFPARQTNLIFDHELYSIKSAAKREPDSITERPTEANTGEVPSVNQKSVQHKGLQRQIFLAFSAFLFLFVSGYYLRLHLKKSTVQNSPQAERILKAELLPTWNLIARPFSQSLQRHTAQLPVFLTEKSSEAVGFTSANLQAFLDQLYELPAKQQLAIFHSTVMLSRHLNEKFKAEAFGNLVDDNFVKFIQVHSSELYLILFDYLQNQVDKQPQLETYLAYLGQNPQSQVAVEAAIALHQLIEIQKRAVQILLETDTIRKMCKGDFMDQTDPMKAFVVCRFIEMHPAIAAADWTRVAEKFDRLRIEVLEHALQNNVTGYRKGDIQTLLAKARFEVAHDPENLQKALAILGAVNDTRGQGRFRFRAAYLNMQVTVKKYSRNIRLRLNRARIEEQLEKLHTEEEALRGQLKVLNSPDGKFQEDLRASWRPVIEKMFNEKSRRMKRLSGTAVPSQRE